MYISHLPHHTLYIWCKVKRKHSYFCATKWKQCIYLESGFLKVQLICWVCTSGTQGCVTVLVVEAKRKPQATAAGQSSVLISRHFAYGLPIKKTKLTYWESNVLINERKQSHLQGRENTNFSDFSKRFVKRRKQIFTWQQQNLGVDCERCNNIKMTFVVMWLRAKNVHDLSNIISWGHMLYRNHMLLYGLPIDGSQIWFRVWLIDGFWIKMIYF